MREPSYSEVIGAGSNGSHMEPPSSLESIAASHDAGEGDSSRPSAPVSSRDKAAGSIRRVGHAVRFVGQVLRKREQGQAAQYADGFAARIEHLATYVGSPTPAPATYVGSPTPAPAAAKGRPLPGTFAHRARFVGLVASRVFKRVRATALRSPQPASEAPSRNRRASGSPSS